MKKDYIIFMLFLEQNNVFQLVLPTFTLVMEQILCIIIINHYKFIEIMFLKLYLIICIPIFLCCLTDISSYFKKIIFKFLQYFVKIM